jgi:hypothetical protein
MLFIIEVILTIFAWRNGWRWISLIPVGICVLLGFTAGFSAGLSGATSLNAGWLVIFDVIAIIALIVMINKKPKSDETKKLLND